MSEVIDNPGDLAAAINAIDNDPRLREAIDQNLKFIASAKRDDWKCIDLTRR